MSDFNWIHTRITISFILNKYSLFSRYMLIRCCYNSDNYCTAKSCYKRQKIVHWNLKRWWQVCLYLWWRLLDIFSTETNQKLNFRIMILINQISFSSVVFQRQIRPIFQLSKYQFKYHLRYGYLIHSNSNSPLHIFGCNIWYLFLLQCLH